MLFILKHSRRAQMFSCKTSAYFVSSTLVCETLGPKHWSDYQIYSPCMHCYLSHHKRGHCEMKLWRLNFCNMWIFLRFVSGSSKIRTPLHFIPNNGQDERVRMCCYLGRYFIMSFWTMGWNTLNFLKLSGKKKIQSELLGLHEPGHLDLRAKGQHSFWDIIKGSRAIQVEGVWTHKQSNKLSCGAQYYCDLSSMCRRRMPGGLIKQPV